MEILSKKFVLARPYNICMQETTTENMQKILPFDFMQTQLSRGKFDLKNSLDAHIRIKYLQNQQEFHK